LLYTRITCGQMNATPSIDAIVPTTPLKVTARR